MSAKNSRYNCVLKTRVAKKGFWQTFGLLGRHVVQDRCPYLGAVGVTSPIQEKMVEELEEGLANFLSGARHQL